MGKSQYIVQFGGLSIGIHEYAFEVKEPFFKNFESSEIEKAQLNVKAVLTKQNNLLQMSFLIEGSVSLDCDRCMKNFDYPVKAEGNLVIKHGDPSESTDEILVIHEGVEQFDVSDYLFEYIILAIHARRVPCELNKKKFICDQNMLEKLNALSTSSPGEEETNNPIWEKLNKIKKLN